jgi:hypothetical protein
MNPEEKEVIWKYIKRKLRFLIREEKIDELRRGAEKEWRAELQRRAQKVAGADLRRRGRHE